MFKESTFSVARHHSSLCIYFLGCHERQCADLGTREIFFRYKRKKRGLLCGCLLPWGDQALEQVAQRGYAVSIFGGVQRSTRCSPV